ncbi:MAG: ComEC/Rec2 family competence protein [Candidatus Uhrbacteria bacterium]
MTLRTSRQSTPRLLLSRHRSKVEHLLVATVMLVIATILFVRESHVPVPVVSSVPAAPFVSSGELRVWFFDVGQGDSIFIETPDHHQILVDGGPSQEVLSKLGQVMQPWDRSIDAIVLTHPHKDHVAGLVSVLERYDVATVYDGGALSHTGEMDAFEADTVAEHAPTKHLVAGDHFAYGDVTLEVLAPTKPIDGTYPKDPNEASVVMLVTYHDTTLLLTGDAPADVEHDILPEVGDVDVLKVGHHGSRTSSSTEFLDAVTPEFAIISDGIDNSYGHPHPATLQRLDDRHIRVERTDLDGDILLTSTGGEPTVEPSPLPF